MLREHRALSLGSNSPRHTSSTSSPSLRSPESDFPGGMHVVVYRPNPQRDHECGVSVNGDAPKAQEAFSDGRAAYLKREGLCHRPSPAAMDPNSPQPIRTKTMAVHDSACNADGEQLYALSFLAVVSLVSLYCFGRMSFLAIPPCMTLGVYIALRYDRADERKRHLHASLNIALALFEFMRLACPVLNLPLDESVYSPIPPTHILRSSASKTISFTSSLHAGTSLHICRLFAVMLNTSQWAHISCAMYQRIIYCQSLGIFLILDLPSSAFPVALRRVDLDPVHILITEVEHFLLCRYGFQSSTIITIAAFVNDRFAFDPATRHRLHLGTLNVYGSIISALNHTCLDSSRRYTILVLLAMLAVTLSPAKAEDILLEIIFGRDSSWDDDSRSICAVSSPAALDIDGSCSVASMPLPSRQSSPFDPSNRKRLGEITNRKHGVVLELPGECGPAQGFTHGMDLVLESGQGFGGESANDPRCADTVVDPGPLSGEIHSAHHPLITFDDALSPLNSEIDLAACDELLDRLVPAKKHTNGPRRHDENVSVIVSQHNDVSSILAGLGTPVKNDRSSPGSKAAIGLQLWRNFSGSPSLFGTYEGIA